MNKGELLVVGLSHRTAPVALRERLAVPPEGAASELRTLMDTGAFREGMLVSTCNRVEVYGTATDPVAAGRAVRAHLGERAQPDAVGGFLYEHWGTDAVRHAFRVAASLDSMVVGEPQILGQVKNAYSTASAAGAIGPLLGRCFSHAFGVAKRVRSETGIAAGAVSVSSIAVELTRKIFGRLEGRRVLLVGAGKMGEAAASKLAKLGARLVVINRSPERAQQLARACGGEPRGHEALASELVAADVVVTSTSSHRFVITAEMMHDVVRGRRRRPLFLIDIAVPRDVDPRAHDMDNVFLYDVDDLSQVANENLAARQREADAAEAIVAAEVAQFERWRRSLDLTPTIVAIRERFQAVVRAELERTLPRLSGLGDKDRRALDAMCNAMVNKLLHKPLTELKEQADSPDGPRLIDAARRLFDLPQAEPAQGAEDASRTAASEAAEDAAETAASVVDLATAQSGKGR